MHYRPYIDGLRALAIILVLIYHGGLALFPSGFVGVDIFFVISGFLITGIIHHSLTQNTFSFIEFYNRRLWRLQPVFICLLLVTSLLTLALFLPEDLLDFNRSARKTSLWISNEFFNKTTTSYFSPDTHQLPLLHTWSLSIEWQCYLILPLLMYVLQKTFSKSLLPLIVLVLCLVSMLIAWYSSIQQPLQTYYQLSSRFFEFLIGAGIALIPPLKWTIPKKIHALIGMTALGSILYIAHLDHIIIGYPNIYALSICSATAALIMLGTIAPQEPISKMLSLKPLVFIGLLSYSLYIWHWMIFALVRYQGISETNSVLSLCYLCTFILGYLSWRYIEKPTRNYKTMPFGYSLVLLILLPIAVIHLNAQFIKGNSGFPQRFNQELVTIYQRLNQASNPQRPLCISNHKTDPAQCLLGDNTAPKAKALLIGDSFSNHYWGFIDTLAKHAQISVLAQATSSCLTLPGISLFDWWYFKNSVYAECKTETARYYQLIKDMHYDYVVIGQIWNNYLSESIINQPGDPRSLEHSKQRIEIALDMALKIITTSGAKPILIKSTAPMQEKSRDCFYQHIKRHRQYDPNECRFMLNNTDSDLWYEALFKRMQNKYKTLVIIDPKKIQCKQGICLADINGVPVYRDAGHITDYASYQLGDLYLAEFGNPMDRKGARGNL